MRRALTLAAVLVCFGAPVADAKLIIPEPEAKSSARTHQERLSDAGVKKAGAVIDISKRKDIKPWRSVAMLNMETGIPQRNIFGCDHGAVGDRPPYCHHKVTRTRVKLLKESSFMNGIGWTQITWKPLVEAYNGRWRYMHEPIEQMKVGFAHLSTLIRNLGVHAGFARYNGSGPAAQAYADRAVVLAQRWKQIGGW